MIKHRRYIFFLIVSLFIIFNMRDVYSNTFKIHPNNQNGIVGDGKTDNTEEIQKIINSGKPLKLTQGIYLVRSLKLPSSFKGLSIQGVGYNNWHNEAGTVLKSISNQPLFIVENGCDWIKISDLKLEGNNLSNIGINASFGAGIILDNVGIYNFIEYGLKSEQGLIRINNCFFSKNKVGVELYSDGTISNSEITGGEVCLKISAGGNRLNNIWLNGSLGSLLVLEPKDRNTEHQNTSISNAYLGEVVGDLNNGVQVLIRGNSNRRVKQVHITNSFFVHGTQTENSNSFFQIENSDEILISNSNIVGRHTFQNEISFTRNFINGIDSKNIKVNGNIIKGINMSSIVVDENCNDWSILNNDFIDCAGWKGANPIIDIKGQHNRFIICQNRFVDYRNNKNVFALLVDQDDGLMFQDNYIYYPNANFLLSRKGHVLRAFNNFR